MTTNKSVVAYFLPLPQFGLSISTNGMGSVQLNPPAGPYLSNSIVTATALPASGWKFLGWTGDFSGTNNPVTLKMDSIKTLAASFVQLPAISLGLEDLSTNVGMDVTFSIGAVGTSPLSYQWWFGSDKLDGYTNSSILLKNVQPGMQGVYSVTVRNPYGSITNSALLDLIVPPTISIQPISRTNLVGSSVAFSVMASGSDPLTYTWKRNGSAITNSPRFAGVNSATLAITNIQGFDAADYFVVVSNQWGSMTSGVARLTVVSKPSIVQDPVGATNYVGATVAFSVLASGTAPLDFRWIKNGVDITNGVSNPQAAISTLTLTNVQTNDSGSYKVIVSNRWGAATSHVAVVVVTLDQAAPDLTISSHTNMQVVGTNHLVLSGTVSDADTGNSGVPTVTVNGSTAIVTSPIGFSSGFWSKEVDVVTGTNVFTVVATDRFANATTNVIRIVLDLGKPTVAIANLASNQRCSNAVITVRGTASDMSGISAVLWRLNSGDWSNAVLASNQNAWSADVNLSSRSNTFQVFAIDMGGNTSATNSVNFTYISCSTLTLWTNGVGAIALNGNKARLEIGRNYSVTASPGRGYVFSNWVNGAGVVMGNKAAYSFTMQSNLTLVANFVTNPFPAVAGSYAGLFYSTNSDGVSVTNAGYFTANVTASGAFTAQIRQKNLIYAFAGKFGLDGAWATNSIKNTPNIGVALQLDMAGSQSISGQITGSTLPPSSHGRGFVITITPVPLPDTTWTSSLLAVRNTYSAVKPAPYKGQYTLVLPGADSNAYLPGGDSAMAITVSPSGIITVNGYMGDGEPISASTFVSSEGRWPFYGSLYGKTGLVLGWLSFSDNQTNNIDGTIAWIKPAKSVNKIYPQGWTYFGADVLGSTFTNKTPIMGWTNGVITLEGGSLSQNVSNALKVSTSSQITGTNGLTLTLTKTGLRAGLFSGTVVNDSRTKASKTVRGALLQNQQIGQGWFLNTNQTGRVLLMEQ